jgi:polysaccharide biosynthesis protein PslG
MGRRTTHTWLAALIASAIVALSIAASVSTAAPERPGERPRASAVRLKGSTLRHSTVRRLLNQLRRRARPRKSLPKPPPASAQQPPPSSPPPFLPPPTELPPLGDARGFGVSFDNPEYLDAATRNRELDSMADMGAKWVRFDVKWSDVQWHGASSFDWSKYDPLVDGARARGLTVLANLAYSPTWARPAGTSDKFAPDTDARRGAFATFAEHAVRHFGGRISHWELWNEPNIPMFWAPTPNAAHYAALVRVTYGRMKAAAPGDCYVLAGATSPASSSGAAIDEVQFLSAVYAAGGGGHFDGWSHHPYTVDPSLPHPDNAWWQVAHTSPSIRSVMQANGDAAKQVWGTEFGPPTSGAPHAMSEADAAGQVTEAYSTWNAYSWSGPLFVYTQRDKYAYGASGDSFNYYGMLRNDFSPKPAWYSYRALATA